MQFGRILFEILLLFVTALHKYVADLSSVATGRDGEVKEPASAKCNLASVCLCVIFRIFPCPGKIKIPESLQGVARQRANQS